MKWIDVDHELPPFDVQVLAYDTQKMYIAYREHDLEYNEHWMICSKQDCCQWNITGPVRYWMPLPKPPKED